MPTASPAVRYRLKVSLRHISPMIWRRLVVPGDLTLYGLHRSIQIAFGWEDYHLHAFKVHGRRYGTDWTGQQHYVEDADDLRELRLRLLFDALSPAGEGDGSEEEGSENEEDDAWALACSYGFDGDDDPLLRYDPAAFERRAVNAELRREFAPAASASGRAGAS